MVAFDVGEQVTPTININYNGADVPTFGIQGSVISRQKVGEDADANLLYVYQVQLSEVVIFGEEGSEQSGQVFWFSESDLGNSSSSTFTALDEGTVSASVGTAKSLSDTNAGIIGQMKDSIPTSNPYYDNLQAYHLLSQRDSDALGSASIDGSDPSDLSRQGGALVTQSDLLSSDSNILKELSENVYGFYTITSEAEEQIRIEQTQSEVQEALAAEEDDLVFSTFVDSFIDGTVASNLLVPSPEGEGTSQTVLGLENVDGLASINPSDLITEALDLEQD